MQSIDPADALAAAHLQLVAIREDPRIKRLAVRYAGHPDLADDALQNAYYAVARRKDLEQIENLRAYFCKVLIHEVYRECRQLGAVLVEDFVRRAEASQEAVGCHPVSPSSIEDTVCTSLQAQTWLERLITNRVRLLAAIPARSAYPRRYRDVVYAVSEQVLRDAISGEPSDADSNDAFRGTYPGYFGQLSASPNLCHQRLRRAREDVKALLQSIISRDELS